MSKRAQTGGWGHPTFTSPPAAAALSSRPEAEDGSGGQSRLWGGGSRGHPIFTLAADIGYIGGSTFARKRS